MGQVDQLRKLIREELRAVLKEELPKLLKENSAPILVDRKKNLQEEVKSKIPSTLNTQLYKPKVNFGSSNPLAAFLNDTAKTMLSEDFNMTSENVLPGMGFQPKEVSVGSIEGMLGSARASSNLDAVQINEVPDFTALMSKMKERGEI